MKKLLLTLSLVIFAAVSFAQKNNDLKINDAKLEKKGNEAVLTFTAYTNKCVKCLDLMTFSPRLEVNGKEIKASAFEVAGRTKANVLRRQERLSKVKSENPRYGKKSKVMYSYTTPYSADLVNAKLKIDRKVENCCKTKNLSTVEVPLKIDESMVPVVVAEPVKVTPKEERIDITLDDAVSFKVGKSILDMKMKNNKESADKVIAAINAIKATKGAKITDISIVGFASPEGSVERNNVLSQERAVAFMEAIIPATELEKWTFKVETGGENWGQLKDMVEKSDLKTKESLLKIINSTGDQAERQAKLSRTAAYNYIFKNFYPKLRNAGFVKVSYTVTE